MNIPNRGIGKGIGAYNPNTFGYGAWCGLFGSIDSNCAQPGTPTLPTTTSVSPGLPYGYDSSTGQVTGNPGGDTNVGDNAIYGSTIVNNANPDPGMYVSGDPNAPWYCSIFGIGCSSSFSATNMLLIAAVVAGIFVVGTSLVTDVTAGVVSSASGGSRTKRRR